MLDINKIKELLEKEKIDELTVYLDEHKNEAADLLYAMGVVCYERQDYKNAIICFESAGEKNHPESMGYLAYIYYYGKGVAKDNGKAYEWAEKGMYENDGNSIYILGLMFEDKSAIDYMLFSPYQNDNLDKDAFKMFKKGEALGHEQCKFKISTINFRFPMKI